MNGWKNVCMQWNYSIENNPETCCNMSEPQKQYTKWKKLDKNVYMWYDPIYIKCSEKTSLWRCRKIIDLLGLSFEGGNDFTWDSQNL